MPRFALAHKAEGRHTAAAEDTLPLTKDSTTNSHVCRLGAMSHPKPLIHPNSLEHSSDNKARKTSSAPELKPPELAVERRLLRHIEHLEPGFRVSLRRASQTWKSPLRTGPTTRISRGCTYSFWMKPDGIGHRPGLCGLWPLPGTGPPLAPSTRLPGSG